MPNSISDPRQAIRDRALAEGFDVIRFTRAAAPLPACTLPDNAAGTGVSTDTSSRLIRATFSPI